MTKGLIGLGLICAGAVWLGTGPVAAQSACDEIDCNQRGEIMCNSDLDCTNRQPFCINGVCQQPRCERDSDCPVGGCVNGLCERVECTSDGGCGSGQVCINHRCEDCETDAQCGERGVCRDHRCVCVECTSAAHCAEDELCSAERTCVPFCGEGQLFLAFFDGQRQCRNCVDPEQARRCNEFPGCGLRDDEVCVQGFCLRRCSLDPPDFDQLAGLLEELERLRTQPQPGGLPDCPRCGLGFELIGVRGALERAGIDVPVRVRLLDPNQQVVAEVGTFAPGKKSWATIPELARPSLLREVPQSGGCGYLLEVSDRSGKNRARAPICLEPRSKPIVLKKT